LLDGKLKPMPARVAVCSIAAAVLVASCATGGQVGELRTDPALFREVVDGHNRIRRGVRPPPEPALGNLSWSGRAAKVASEWAARCKFRHNPGRGALGENLFAMSGGQPDVTVVARALRSWASESADYDYRSDKCRAGAVCGHYTQMIWRETRGIGCALARCSGGSPFDDATWSLVVCNYDPPGNVVGRKPY
jgi:pathogenesis-related protein 1